MKDQISIKEGYKAMFLYLEHLYEMTGSDDLAGFLGSMSLLEDDMPVDDAVWSDWLEAVAKARMNPNIDLNIENQL
ncbi:hypothetical protein [Rheinheimera baltica]|uniref:hypothetical protein n=1 Tax=Rheinheimera baltica TaxID=67576 RepID=UPI0004123A6F|nr:hypothetical protein [Rheinheimera baltica]